MLSELRTTFSNYRLFATAVAIVGAGLVTACGGGGGGSTPPPPTLTSISVTPASPSVTRGATQQLTATGTYSDGSTTNLTSTVTWSSSSTATATVAGGGLASALAIGSTTISATSGSVSGSTVLTVTPPPLTSIAVSPSAPTVGRGRTQQFTATGTFSDSTTADLTSSVTWSSSEATIASIATGGLATAVNVGTATIRAAQGAVSGTTSITVTAPILTSLAVTPGAVTMDYQGATQQFVATGTYSDQSTADLTNTAMWSSSAATTAAVGVDGFVTALATGGAATITAQTGGFSASANLTIRTATVSGTITIPDSDMGWKPTIGDYQNQGAGAKVRVLGTSISADVVATGGNTGTFSLTGVPIGTVTLVFDEGSVFDVFSAASKRVVVNVNSTAVAGVSFDFVYHWRELAGYPPPWGTNNTQGPVVWKAQFVNENVAFITFRLDIPSDRIELWRTTDRGANWSRIGQWIFDPALFNAGNWAYPSGWVDFYFLDANRGVVHGTMRGIPCNTGHVEFQTSDGGQTWTVRTLPFPPNTYYLEHQTYARLGNDRIVLAASTGCNVQGYASDFYDVVFESADAGVTWERKWNSAANARAAFVGIDGNGSGRAVALRGTSTQEFLLRDAQGTWTAGANPLGILSTGRDLAMVGDVAWVGSSGGVAQDGFYRSANAGASWARVSGGLPQDFDFVTLLKGFAQAGGPVYATYDSGVIWRYQTPGGAIWPGAMDVWAFDRTRAARAEIGFGDPNGVAQLYTYVEPALASIELIALAVPPSATVGRGAANNVMANYELRNNGPVPVSVQSITLRASGSANDATDIAAVKLWRDTNEDGMLDGGDTQLGSGTIAANNATVTFATGGLSALDQMQSVRLLVTYDLAGTGTYTGTFRFAATAADISAKDAESPAVVAITLPSGVALTSRTLTVAP
jgi:hypothetical protein